MEKFDYSGVQKNHLFCFVYLFPHILQVLKQYIVIRLFRQQSDRVSCTERQLQEDYSIDSQSMKTSVFSFPAFFYHVTFGT